jgi:hypothetical protein
MTNFRKMRWARDVAYMGEMKNVYDILIVKPEGKRVLGRWDNNTKMYHRKIGFFGCGVDLFDLGQGRWWAVMNMVMNLWVP